jgi:hypothetical protein
MLQTVKKLDSKTIKVILSLLTDKSVVILYVFIFKIKYPICCDDLPKPSPRVKKDKVRPGPATKSIKLDEPKNLRVK